MAKASTKKKAIRGKRHPGRKRTVPGKVSKKVQTALGAVRQAKSMMGNNAAWRELHNVESRLSRLV